MFEIRPDDLTSPLVHALLEDHLTEMRSISPPESVHALDLERLRQPDIRFWTVWTGDTLVGCGALKTHDARHGEIKSMRTVAGFRGQGVGRAMLRHILTVAAEAGLQRLSLETGAEPEFMPARRLYEQHGFTYCPPFADYREDPNSVFMTRVL